MSVISVRPKDGRVTSLPTFTAILTGRRILICRGGPSRYKISGSFRLEHDLSQPSNPSSRESGFRLRFVIEIHGLGGIAVVEPNQRLARAVGSLTVRTR